MSTHKTVLDSTLIKKYKEVALDVVKLHFPYIQPEELERAVNWSIDKRFRDVNATIDNNYKKRQVKGTLLEFTDYILDKQPIITSYGVLFSRHGTVPNPLYKMIDNFINDRGYLKNEMFKYPKGSEEFKKYNLLQLLAKLDANALYGALGKFSCIYYNLYVASTTTTQGRSCNSAAALMFESILNNNVPMGSLNEMITFIHIIKQQTKERKFEDRDILDRDITIQECFFQLMASTGFGWVPTEKEMHLVWEILLGLDQTTVNRLFYKNNLFNFVENVRVLDSIKYILQKLEEPFMNPNEVPEEIKMEMDALYDLIYEYVYYDQQIIDRLEKMESLIRSVSIIQDTDSAIVSFDGWYRFIREKVLYVPMKIKGILTPAINYIDEEQHQEVEYVKAQYTDYDFLNDEIIEAEKELMIDKIIPQEGFRISIINIMANIIGRLIIDYMYKYTVNSQSAAPNRKCLIIMKNEYLFKRVLQIPDAKKNYASNMELQEGNIIPEGEKLDIKGIPCFVKSTSNETIRERLKGILYDDILNTDDIDQVKVLKDLAIIEREIYNSLMAGEKKYLKPAKIKSMNNYEDPMRIQGIKASVAYNAIKTDDMDPIDLEARNSIDIIKMDMNLKNIDRIRQTYPDVYEKAVALMGTKEYDGSIDALALPANENIPEWAIPFIKYYEIINDNIALFPLEAIGIYRGGKSNNYTNIINF